MPLLGTWHSRNWLHLHDSISVIDALFGSPIAMRFRVLAPRALNRDKQGAQVVSGESLIAAFGPLLLDAVPDALERLVTIGASIPCREEVDA